ncbi:hypothetical protein OC834_005586 [Tilletia horrida]|nr:hypothetical protein OC834_005586 [Tilletia horrida]
MDDTDSAGFTVPPLSAASLVETLELAAQPSPDALHRADSTLTAWERTDASFCARLLDVAFDDAAAAPGTNAAVRIGAIIRLKNVCERYWRPRVVSRVQLALLSDDVKTHVRTALLQRTLTERDRAVAVQATLCIAKIARTDFPAQWPDLFDFCQAQMERAYAALQQQQQQQQPLAREEEEQYRLVLLRAAEICARALKTLASAKLLASKIRMTELSRQLLPTLHPIFSELFRSNLPSDASGAASLDLQTLGAWASTPLLTERIRTSHLLLKCLTYLAVADMGMITARTFTARINTSASDTSSSSASQEHDNSPNLAQAFFRSMPVFLQQIFDLRSALVAALISTAADSSDARTTLRPLLASLTKHLIAFSKLFLALVERDKSKAARWDGWAEVVLWYWARAAEYDPFAGRPLEWNAGSGSSSGLEGLALDSSDSDADAGTTANADPGAAVVLPARLVIHALVLLRLTLSELKRAGTTLPPSSAPLLSEDFLANVLETVLSRHMLLTRPALYGWVFDAETWVLVEGKGAESISTPVDGSAGDEVEVRHAGERLLVGIVQANKQAAEKVWALFESFGPPTGAEAYEIGSVVSRDALYNALGYVTPYLSDTDARVSAAVRRLLPEASGPPSAPPTWLIIRRRILLLLDAWIEHIPEADLAACFPVVLSLLPTSSDGRTDTVVRLTAVGTLWQLVDTVAFKPEMLAPHMADALRLLCILISGRGGADEDGEGTELEDLSSIRSCTRTLALVTERMGAAVVPHVPVLAGLIPGLWERDDDQCRIRPGVLVLTGRLLSAIALVIPADGSDPPSSSGTTRQQVEELHGIAALMIEQSLQPRMAALMGIDALHLWSRALSSTPYMTTPLFSLLRLVPAMLSSPDYTQHVCSVITSSALLAPREVVAQYGEAIWAETAGMVADEMCSEITHVLKMVDEMVLAVGSAAGAKEEGGNLWAEAVVRSGLAYALLGATLHFQESSVIGAAFISTIARIAVMAQAGIFLHIVRDSASKLVGPLGASSAEEAYSMATKKLVQLFCERFENMASRHRRRLVALALATMLEDANGAQDGLLYEAVPEMVTPWTEVLEDEQERVGQSHAADGGAPGRPVSPLDTIGEDIEDAEWLDDAGPSPETARWTRLREADPARSGVFASQLSRVLGVAQGKAPDAFNAGMGRVDPLVLDILMRGLQTLTQAQPA